MNKVITINLNGNAYQLEEGGYEALRAYLAHAARMLEGNPDKAEILADIEQAIADKCRAALGSYKSVVGAAEVERIVSEMGPVDGGSAQAEAGPASGGPEPRPAAAEPAPAPRRLYRLDEGRMIGGVCNGIAAYFGLDPTWVRLGFVALFFLTVGVMIPVYIVLLLVVPEAETEAEKAAASGGPFTAQEFIRRARAGYYEGMKHFHDKRAHRAWKRKFRREMREWGRNFRHEMRETSRQFQGRGWQFQGSWFPFRGAPPRPGFFSGLILALCSLCRWILSVAFIFALVSVICTGAVFGLFALPGIPLWFAIVLLIVGFQLAMLPFKVVKHAVWGCGAWGSPWASPFAVLGETLGGLIVLALVLLLAAQMFPSVHEALRHLPQTLRHLPQALRDLGQSIQDWWNAGR